MKTMNYLNKYIKHISAAMMALTILMFFDAIYQTQMHIRWRSWLPNSLLCQSASTQPTTNEATKDKPPSKPARLHASIKKRNIFIKPQPRGHGLKLTGVMGRFALFSDQRGKTIGIEEGKSGKGVTVKAIEGYEVTIDYKGKTETMKLFKLNSSPRPSLPSPPKLPMESVQPAGMTKVDKQNILHRKGTTQPCATMP